MQTAHTILISDIHLGSRLTNAKLLLGVLRHWTFERLIIVGDLIASKNLSRLSRIEWKFLGYLRRLISAGIEVIWIEGNHDISLIENLSQLLGIKMCERFEWIYNGKKFLAIHGHQFDKLMGGIFSDVVSWVYLRMLAIPWFRHHFGKELSIWSRGWQRITPIVYEKAIHLAQHLGCAYVFCGHTHESLRRLKNGITYINTGCWVEREYTLVSVGEEVVVHQYKDEDILGLG